MTLCKIKNCYKPAIVGELRCRRHRLKDQGYKNFQRLREMQALAGTDEVKHGR